MIRNGNCIRKSISSRIITKFYVKQPHAYAQSVATNSLNANVTNVHLLTRLIITSFHWEKSAKYIRGMTDITLPNYIQRRLNKIEESYPEYFASKNRSMKSTHFILRSNDGSTGKHMGDSVEFRVNDLPENIRKEIIEAYWAPEFP